MRLSPTDFGNAGERPDSPRLAATAHLAAFLASLCFSLPLRLAGQLGFYDNDYNQLQEFLGPHRRPLVRYFLTDEPLFNVYHALRYSILGDQPRPHHLLQGFLLALNATLAFSLVWRLSKNRLLPFVFLLLFLTYPNRGEAYFWPAAAYVPMLFVLLVGLHFCLTWLETGRREFYAAGWLAYSIAVFTHEAAFGFLAVFAALWLFHRAGSASWREGIRFLTPLAATNGAYLVVRQTRWFGIGDPRYFYERRFYLEPAAFFGNLLYSFRVNFGEPFLEKVQSLMRSGSRGMLLPFAGMLAALLVAAVVFEGRQVSAWLHLKGALIAPALILAAALYTEQAPFPEFPWLLRTVLRLLVLLVLAAAVKLLLFPAPLPSELVRLAAFGAFWFFAAYAPAWVSGVADRHSYLPSVGSCLLLAAALLFPPTCAREARHRQYLEGLALGLTALLGVAFYAACLGEGDRWVSAGRFVSRLHDQMLAARPGLPPDARVIVLATPPSSEMLPGYAFEAAVKHWYHDPRILAGREFVPEKGAFRFPYSGAAQPYDWLLLFTYNGKEVSQVKHLVFEDGAKVPLGAALDAAGAGRHVTSAGDAASLAVIAGQLVGHY